VWSASRPGRLYPRERPCTHCIGGWVGPRAGLDRCRKSYPTGIRSPDLPARSKSLLLCVCVCIYIYPPPPSIFSLWCHNIIKIISYSLRLCACVLVIFTVCLELSPMYSLPSIWLLQLLCALAVVMFDSMLCVLL
jgi:hypothetical protein